MTFFRFVDPWDEPVDYWPSNWEDAARAVAEQDYLFRHAAGGHLHGVPVNVEFTEEASSEQIEKFHALRDRTVQNADRTR